MRVLPRRPGHIVPMTVLFFAGVGALTSIQNPDSLAGMVTEAVIIVLIGGLIVLFDRAEDPSA